MQVWDGVSGSRISFDWPTTQQDDSDNIIAYMNENLNLTSGCLRRLQELGGVDVFDQAKIENIGYGTKTDLADLSQWPVVRLADGQSLTARLLIGADGANSLVRSFSGIGTRGWDYNRHGVVATLRMEKSGIHPAYKTAYQRFLPSGPVALLPVCFVLHLFLSANPS
jgi:ubiquinone biosynthesis monooxygenase Coq6